MARTAAKTSDATKGKTVETVTRTREVVEEPAAELDISGELAGAEDSDPLAKLDEIGVDGSAKYRVHRTSPSGFDGYIGTYTRDELSPDRIFEEWGGGRFRITVVDGKGAIRGNAILMVAGKPKHKSEPASAPQPVAQQGAGELAGVLSAIQASNVAAREAQGAQITLLTTLLTSLINKEAPKQPPPPDPLAMLEKAANILKPRGDSGADAVKMLLQGMEIANKFGGGGHEPGMADVFLEGFKTIKEAVDKVPNAHRPRSAQRRIAAPPGAVPAAEVAAPAPPAEPVTDAMRQDRWIKQQVEFLVVQASRQKDPELYAELFLDNLPAFLAEEEAQRRMSDEGELRKMAEAVPAVMNYLPWFEKFREAVLGFIEQGTRQAADHGVVVDHGAAGDDNASPEVVGEGG